MKTIIIAVFTIIFQFIGAQVIANVQFLAWNENSKHISILEEDVILDEFENEKCHLTITSEKETGVVTMEMDIKSQGKYDILVMNESGAFLLYETVYCDSGCKLYMDLDEEIKPGKYQIIIDHPTGQYKHNFKLD